MTGQDQSHVWTNELDPNDEDQTITSIINQLQQENSTDKPQTNLSKQTNPYPNQNFNQHPGQPTTSLQTTPNHPPTTSTKTSTYRHTIPKNTKQQQTQT